MMMFRVFMIQIMKVLVGSWVELYDMYSMASIYITQAQMGGIIRLTGLQEDNVLRIPAVVSLRRGGSRT